MRYTFASIVASLLLVGAVQRALADKAPSADQQGRIESELKKAGFTTWKGIEMDNGRWEVDAAA